MFVSKMSRVLVAVLLVFCVAMTSGCWEKSNSERVGKITKFGNKGLFFKTWEGEMFTTNLSGRAGNTNPYAWQFSVEDEATAKQVQQMMDTCPGDVGLKYIEEQFVAPWRAESHYLVKVAHCR